MPSREYKTLVLNADFKPLSTWPLSIIPARDAVSAFYRDRVTVVEEWDEVFRSPSTEIRIPKTVALRQFASVAAAPKFCRRSILLRDRYRCQYCGEKFDSQDLTFDHLVPRAKGGKTKWDNILTCCVTCNARKGSQDANLSAPKGKGYLRPLKLPRRPTSSELLRNGLEFLPSDIKQDWGSFLYWDVELAP